jgi:hypothetical protein
MSLQGGKCNVGIKIVKREGVDFVERLYEQNTVDEKQFHDDVRVAFAVGLTTSTNWYVHDEGDFQRVGNPKMELVDNGSVKQEVLWEAYEEAFAKLRLLWHDHKIIVSDAHSLNLRLCKVGESSFSILLLDGKVGGLTREASTRRLYVKLRYEQVPEHRWLLHQYVNFLHKEGVQ